jgi:serine/threonine-protein kinase
MPRHPARIGKYEVLEVVGRGGMGVVYKATDPQIGRFVAIKMITGGDLERFYAEAKSTGNLQCPNIVTVHDLGDHEGNPYLVMEYLDGVSLESILASGRPMSLLEKLRVMTDVCNGLSYAHQRNIIHRDIKPGNIMVLNDGATKIVDFGIARVGDRRMTKTDQVIGSLHYMSPEQIQCRPLDGGTDIFSTGVVLYQLLTGVLPFEASDTGATLMKIIHDPPPPLNAYIRDIPPELDQVVGRALAKSRDERYVGARDMAFDLVRIAEQHRQVAVAQFLAGAESAMQHGEWSTARERLQQVLSVDRQHAQARRLLGEVQERIRKQQRGEESLRLRSQADEEFANLRYDDAVRLLDQAISLDETNNEVREFRVLVQTAKSRAAKLQMALRRAEAAHHAGDLDQAQQAVEEALALDPNETQARALQLVITKQIKERARQIHMRKLLDNAHSLLSAHKITESFEILKGAEAVDPGSLELQSLLKLAQAAQAQETRKAELARLAQQIEEALIREDYASASSQAEAGLQKYPREQSLLKLKTLADTQRERLEEKAYVRAQFISASTLLDSGKTVEALSTLETALQRVPHEAQLESLRSIIKERLTQEESEDHLQRSLESAQRAIATGDFGGAVRILESTKQEFDDSRDVDELLHTAEAFLVKERSVQQTLTSAHELLGDKDLNKAVQVLEGALRQGSDRRISDLLADVRNQLSQFQRGLENAIKEGERILREHGSEPASAFLQAQPLSYRDVPNFRALTQRVSERDAAELLNRQLALESRLATRLQLAEAALRRSPGNEEIEQVLASVRERKNLVDSVVETARDLESSLQYEESSQELTKLRELHPEYPNLEAEILRITKLGGQKRLLSQQLPNATLKPLGVTVEQRREGASATKIMHPAQTESEIAGLPADRMASHDEERDAARTTIFGTGHLTTGPRPSHRTIALAMATLAAILALSGTTFLHFRHHPALVAAISSGAAPNKTTSVLNTDPTATVSSASETSPIPAVAAETTLAVQREKMPFSPNEKRSGSKSANHGSIDQLPVAPVPAAGAGSVSSAAPQTDKLSNGAGTTNKEVRKDDSTTHAGPTLAISQPPPSLPTQPRKETSAVPSIPQPDSAPKTELPSSAKPTRESEAVRSALRSYEDAYASMDIGVFKGVWPSLSRDQIRKLKDGFRGAQAVKVNLDCGDPALSGDTASVRCAQSMAYTRDGRRQPPQTVSVAILLKKTASGNWLVDKVQ